MKVIKSPTELSEIIRLLKRKGKRVGFVPTMGYLHEGHLSLVRRAQRENDIVVVSIFVNPTQFGPKEDFKRYPKNLAHDKKLLSRAHINYLFVPSKDSIYPKGFRAFVSPGLPARYLCGPKRPGHFRGVATVVKRFFEIVKPHTAYFGEKDYQQARVIEYMVKRFCLSVKIKTCPIVREADGLAMSSRNRYLSRAERASASSVYRSLLVGRKLIKLGERNVKKIKKAIQDILRVNITRIDYIELVNSKTCAPVQRARPPVLIAIACFLGSTRLIDNILVKV